MPHTFEDDICDKLSEIHEPLGAMFRGVIEARKREMDLMEIIGTEFAIFLKECQNELLQWDDENPAVIRDLAKRLTAGIDSDAKSLKHFCQFTRNVVMPLIGYEAMPDRDWKLPSACPECRSRRYDVCKVNDLQWHGHCRKCGRVHQYHTDILGVPLAPGCKVSREVAFTLGMLHVMGLSLSQTQEFAIGDSKQFNLIDEVHEWAVRIGKVLVDRIAFQLQSQAAVVVDEMKIADAENEPASALQNRLVVHTSGHMEDRPCAVFNIVRRRTEAVVSGGKEYDSYSSQVLARVEHCDQISLAHLRRKIINSIDWGRLNLEMYGRRDGLQRISAKAHERARERGKVGLAHGEPLFLLGNVHGTLQRVDQIEKGLKRRNNENLSDWFERIRYYRLKDSLPLMDALDERMKCLAERLAVEEVDGIYVPKDSDEPMAVAVCYYMNNRDGFRVFLSNPSIEADSSSTIRSVRAHVVLRRALEFDRSGKYLDSLCIYFTLVETAKLNGFNAAKTIKWLRDFSRAYYLHRANATLTEQVNNCGRALNEELTAFTPESAEGFDVEPWLPWNYGRRRKRAA